LELSGYWFGTSNAAYIPSRSAQNRAEGTVFALLRDFSRFTRDFGPAYSTARVRPRIAPLSNTYDSSKFEHTNPDPHDVLGFPLADGGGLGVVLLSIPAKHEFSLEILHDQSLELGVDVVPDQTCGPMARRSRDRYIQSAAVSLSGLQADQQP